MLEKEIYRFRLQQYFLVGVVYLFFRKLKLVTMGQDCETVFIYLRIKRQLAYIKVTTHLVSTLRRSRSLQLMASGTINSLLEQKGY